MNFPDRGIYINMYGYSPLMKGATNHWRDLSRATHTSTQEDCVIVVKRATPLDLSCLICYRISKFKIKNVRF